MSWNDTEAILEERFEADLLQASYEEQGNAFARRQRRMKALRDAGQLGEAAEQCGHDGGYPLDSPAADYENDPFKGEDGVRCTSCGSRLSTWAWDDGVVTVPCELAAYTAESFRLAQGLEA